MRVSRKREVWSYSGQRWWIEITQALTGITHPWRARISVIGYGALYRDESWAFETVREARDWCAERVAAFMGAAT